MYNKELYGKIINVSCSFEELESFVSDISKKELDIDNAFEKYYDFIQNIAHIFSFKILIKCSELGVGLNCKGSAFRIKNGTLPVVHRMIFYLYFCSEQYPIPRIE
jgi:hypothetical protein